MAKLIETEEAVEKAGKGMIRGGSSGKLARRMRRLLVDKNSGSRRGRAGSYLASRLKGRPFGGLGGTGHRTGIYKSLTALDTAIEKARGLIRGGSSRTNARMGSRGFKSLKLGDIRGFSRASTAQRYLSGRLKGAGWAEGKLFRTGRYK